MKRISCAALVVAMFAAAPSVASAAATDGQWVLIDQQPTGHALVTVNPPEQYGSPGERTLHTAPAGVALDAPQWSPDGNRIVFAEGRRILLYDLASAKVSELAPDGASPSWSRDGSRVSFLRGGALLTRALDGTGEQALPIDATGVRDAAWSPDGAAFALWSGDRLETVGADGSGRGVFDEGVRGGAAWSPDANWLLYPRFVPELDAVVLWEADDEDEGPVGLLGSPTDPEYAPSGGAIVYSRTDTITGRRMVAWERGQTSSSIEHSTWAQVDWQPCVAGVTVSCRSTTPPVPLVPMTCAPSPGKFNVVSGRTFTVRSPCRIADLHTLVEPPAHGTLTPTSDGFIYQSHAGYVGPDAFTYTSTRRGRVSEPIRAELNVVAPRVKTAAPKFTVAPGRLRLDRHGRVTLRGTCDRECTVKVRVRVKLTSGRVVNGRLVGGHASAGGQVKLVLKRGKLPPRRKVAWARISGTAVGADGRERAVRLTLR